MDKSLLASTIRKINLNKTTIYATEIIRFYYQEWSFFEKVCPPLWEKCAHPNQSVDFIMEL